MSDLNASTNGGAPPRLATILEILKASEKTVELPSLSETLGEPRTLKIRKLSRAEFMVCLPPNPAGSEEWSKEEWPAKERAWLETLEPDAFQARRQALANLNFRLVAVAALDPTLTLDQARRLGDDAATVASEILSFSGIGQAAASDPEILPAVPAVPAVPVEPVAD